MKALVELFNDMQKKKIIRKWALAGGIAAKYYVNPPATKDIDFFVILDDMKALCFMQGVYDYMTAHGATFKGQHLKYKNYLVDVLAANNELVIEAVKKANTVKMDGASVKIVSPDYLALIALQVGRPKDIDRAKRLYQNNLLTDEFFKLANKYNIPKVRL